MGIGALKIATLRGPSAVEMLKMMDDARLSDGPEVTVFDEPVQLLSGMAGGNVDFAVLPTAMASSLRDRGIAYSIVAIVIWGGLYVCGKDNRISSIADLRGRTINAMSKGSAPENLLRQLMVKAGLDPDNEVHFDYSYPSHKELSEAVASGRSELCILSEPFVSQALETNADLYALLDIAEEWRQVEGSLPPVAAFLCKDSLIDNDPDKVREVISALRLSCEWVKANPVEAGELAVSLDVFSDAEAVRKSISRSGFDVLDIVVNI